MEETDKLEREAYIEFCKVRWPDTNGEPICPRCGHDEYYNISTRNTFKCKSCMHMFSPTSGTEWANRKLTYKKIMDIMKFIVENDSNISEISRENNINYRSAWFIVKRSRI